MDTKENDLLARCSEAARKLYALLKQAITQR